MASTSLFSSLHQALHLTRSLWVRRAIRTIGILWMLFFAHANAEEIDVKSDAASNLKAPPESSSPAPSNHADGVVWCALIHATPPGESPPQMPEALKPLQGILETAQPKQKFELISQTSELVLKEYDTWVVLSDELYLRLDSGGIVDTQSINLYLQLWRDKKVLLKTETLLRKGSPVIIQGPPYHGGRLLFVIQLEKVL